MKFYSLLSVSLMVLGGLDVTLAASEETGRGRLASTGTPGQVIDMVVAAIDGEPLTLADLKEYARAQGEASAEEVNSSEFNPAKYLRDFLLQQLLEKEAKSLGINSTDEEIATYIDEIKRQNGTDDEGLKVLLKSKGLTLDEYRKQVSADIIKTRVLASRVRSKINISDEDVSKYINSQDGKGPAMGEVHLLQIFIPYGEGIDIGTEKREVSALAARMKDPQDLVEAGGKHASDLGYVSPGDLTSELKDAVKELKPGQISPVIETDKGLYVIALKDRYEGEISEELKAQYRKELFDRKFKEAIENFLGVELPKKYNVEIKI